MAATATAQALSSCCSAVTKSTFVAGRSLRSVQTAAVAGRKVAFTVRAAKGNWLPGSVSPAYLDGTLAGDNGFDPLGLSATPESLKWNVQAELVHGRWAMLGAAGILFTDLGREAGFLNVPNWVDANTAEYGIPTPVLTVILFNLFAWAESRRWVDIVYPGTVSEDPIFKGNKLSGTDVGYPGVDPLGLGKGDVLTIREKEIANGRLAMLANLGFWVQYAYTGEGPIANLSAHLADPGHNNFFGTFF